MIEARQAILRESLQIYCSLERPTRKNLLLIPIQRISYSIIAGHVAVNHAGRVFLRAECEREEEAEEA
jgi:hypothetical protein